MGAVPEEAEEAGGDKEEVGAARRWRGRGGGRGRGRRGGVAASRWRRGGRAAASGEERGRGSRARAREREGIGLGRGGSMYGGGTILMAHHTSVRHKYIYTNGTPCPGAPLVFFFDFCSSQQVISHLT